MERFPKWKKKVHEKFHMTAGFPASEKLEELPTLGFLPAELRAVVLSLLKGV